MKVSRRGVVFALASVPFFSVANAAARSRPRAIRVKLAGADNLYKVDRRLYRSAQPTRAGFNNLSKSLGIKAVVSLREFHNDESLARGVPITLHRVGFNTWHIGDDDGEKIVRALRLIRKAETQGSVLVHCQHGSDRTGAIIALYRILYQGVTKEAAIQEMMEGGFGFHPIWASLPVWGNIPAYIRSVDIAHLRRRIETSD